MAHSHHVSPLLSLSSTPNQNLLCRSKARERETKRTNKTKAPGEVPDSGPFWRRGKEREGGEQRCVCVCEREQSFPQVGGWRIAGALGERMCDRSYMKSVIAIESTSLSRRCLCRMQLLAVLVACASVVRMASAVPHHHEHDRSEVQPAQVFPLVGLHGTVHKSPPRMAPHRGVHKWRAINSVAHHINEAYGNHDEEVSAEEFGRWYRENRPKVRLPSAFRRVPQHTLFISSLASVVCNRPLLSSSMLRAE